MVRLTSWLDGVESMETHATIMEPHGDSEGNKTATPLRLSIFPRLSWENSILDIRVLLHGYFLHEYMFFSRNRPPDRTFRAESDSSTPEVSGGLSVVVFEAFRRAPEPAA